MPQPTYILTYNNCLDSRGAFACYSRLFGRSTEDARFVSYVICFTYGFSYFLSHCQSLDFTSDLERKRKVKMELDGDSDIEIVGPTASTSVSTGSFDDNLSAIRDSFLTMLSKLHFND